MTKTQKAAAIIGELKDIYPDAFCGLEAGGSPFRLFVMAVLSAQCTDARVNTVAKDLFAALPDAKAFADSKDGELEALIHSVGLFNSKAKNLRAACRMIVDDFGGEIPIEMDDLLKLPGVGRKVANLLRGDIYGLGGIVADTHCIRICGRLGLSGGKDPLETERSLSKIIPLSEQSVFCHRIVRFGRDTCMARNPSCGDCKLKQYCVFKKEADNG